MPKLLELANAIRLGQSTLPLFVGMVLLPCERVFPLYTTACRAAKIARNSTRPRCRFAFGIPAAHSLCWSMQRITAGPLDVGMSITVHDIAAASGKYVTAKPSTVWSLLAKMPVRGALPCSV